MSDEKQKPWRPKVGDWCWSPDGIGFDRTFATREAALENAPTPSPSGRLFLARVEEAVDFDQEFREEVEAIVEAAIEEAPGFCQYYMEDEFPASALDELRGSLTPIVSAWIEERALPIMRTMVLRDHNELYIIDDDSVEEVLQTESPADTLTRK